MTSIERDDYETSITLDEGTVVVLEGVTVMISKGESGVYDHLSSSTASTGSRLESQAESMPGHTLQSTIPHLT